MYDWRWKKTGWTVLLIDVFALFLGFHERKIKHMRKWKTKTETEKGVCCVIVLFRTHTLYTSDVWSSPFVQCLTDIAWWTRTSRPELLLSWTWPCGNYLFWLWAVVYTHSYLGSGGKGGFFLWGMYSFPTNCYRSNHTLIIHITVIQYLCVTRACSCTVALHYTVSLNYYILIPRVFPPVSFVRFHFV